MLSWKRYEKAQASSGGTTLVGTYMAGADIASALQDACQPMSKCTVRHTSTLQTAVTQVGSNVRGKRCSVASTAASSEERNCELLGTASRISFSDKITALALADEHTPAGDSKDNTIQHEGVADRDGLFV